MMKLTRIVATSHVTLLALAFSLPAATPVLTRAYDNGRTGSNTSEGTLTANNVGTRQMKILKSIDIPDDPRLEAMPLYVPGIDLKDGKKHNTLFVCSMANTVYAFDVDAAVTQPVWKISLGQSYLPPPDPQNGPRAKKGDLYGINNRWGVLSTPVIDMDAPGGPAMYIVNWVAPNNNPALRLHAIRLRDGSLIKTAPIAASTSNAAGKQVLLRPNQKQRAALLLTPLRGANKKLFIATAGGENPGAPNGWVVAFDVAGAFAAADWKMIDAWAATPNSFGGGLWQAGQGPAADDSGAVYAMTGNGGYTVANGHLNDFIGKGDFGESFVKLALTGAPGSQKLTLVDFFTPFRDAHRNGNYRDQDLGSGAPLVPPGTNLVLGAGKDGVLYVMDRNNMGKVIADFTKLKSPAIFFTYFPGPQFPPTGNLDFQGNIKTHHLHGSPVFWNSPDAGGMLFDWGENECLRAWTMDAAGKVTFIAKSAEIASAALADPNVKGEGGMPGGMPTLSANGTAKNTGVIWATAPITGNANQAIVEGIVRAYDAVSLDVHNNNDGTRRLKLIWDSTRIANKRFAFCKFGSPLVADGMLFVPTYGSWPDKAGNHGRIDIYVLK